MGWFGKKQQPASIIIPDNETQRIVSAWLSHFRRPYHKFLPQNVVSYDDVRTFLEV